MPQGGPMICQKLRETLVVTTPLQVTRLAVTVSTMSHLMQAVGAQQQSQNNVGDRGIPGEHGPQSKYERPSTPSPCEPCYIFSAWQAVTSRVKFEYLRRSWGIDGKFRRLSPGSFKNEFKVFKTDLKPSKTSMLSCPCQEVLAANGRSLQLEELSWAGKAHGNRYLKAVRPDAAPRDAPVPALQSGVRSGAVKILMPFYLPFYSVF